MPSLRHYLLTDSTDPPAGWSKFAFGGSSATIEALTTAEMPLHGGRYGFACLVDEAAAAYRANPLPGGNLSCADQWLALRILAYQREAPAGLLTWCMIEDVGALTVQVLADAGTLKLAVSGGATMDTGMALPVGRPFVVEVALEATNPGSAYVFLDGALVGSAVHNLDALDEVDLLDIGGDSFGAPAETGHLVVAEAALASGPDLMATLACLPPMDGRAVSTPRTDSRRNRLDYLRDHPAPSYPA